MKRAFVFFVLAAAVMALAPGCVEKKAPPAPGASTLAMFGFIFMLVFLLIKVTDRPY